MASLGSVARLLALIPYLQEQGTVTVAQTAEHFGVSQVQILRDIQTLVFCGLPDEYFRDRIDIDMDVARDEGIITIRDAEFLTRPTRFTPDEAMALIVALGTMGDIAPGNTAAAIESAKAKLVAASGANPHVDVLVDSGDHDCLVEIQKGLEARVVLEGSYQGTSSLRQVALEPVRLFSRAGYAYLEGWDLTLDQWRFYRLDRFVQVAATERRCEVREVPEPSESWQAVFAHGTVVELELQPEARWVTEYFPMLDVNRDQDIWVAKLSVVSMTWFTSLLLRLGSSARVRSPKGADFGAKRAAAEALEFFRAEGFGVD